MNIGELKLLLNKFPNEMEVMIHQNDGRCIGDIQFNIHNVRMIHEHMGDGMYVEWFDIHSEGRKTLLLKTISKLGFVKTS